MNCLNTLFGAAHLYRHKKKATAITSAYIQGDSKSKQPFQAAIWVI